VFRWQKAQIRVVKFIELKPAFGDTTIEHRAVALRPHSILDQSAQGDAERPWLVLGAVSEKPDAMNLSMAQAAQHHEVSRSLAAETFIGQVMDV
jgi:hypothetical protein